MTTTVRNKSAGSITMIIAVGLVGAVLLFLLAKMIGIPVFPGDWNRSYSAVDDLCDVLDPADFEQVVGADARAGETKAESNGDSTSMNCTLKSGSKSPIDSSLSISATVEPGSDSPFGGFWEAPDTYGMEEVEGPWEEAHLLAVPESQRYGLLVRDGNLELEIEHLIFTKGQVTQRESLEVMTEYAKQIQAELER